MMLFLYGPACGTVLLWKYFKVFAQAFSTVSQRGYRNLEVNQSLYLALHGLCSKA